MNESENKFDDIIRSKFSGQQFPFDEENWEKAEEMIEAKRANSKRKHWAIIYFFGFLSGILLMLPFVFRKNETVVLADAGIHRQEISSVPEERTTLQEKSTASEIVNPETKSAQQENILVKTETEKKISQPAEVVVPLKNKMHKNETVNSTETTSAQIKNEEINAQQEVAVNITKNSVHLNPGIVTTEQQKEEVKSSPEEKKLPDAVKKDSAAAIVANNGKDPLPAQQKTGTDSSNVSASVPSPATNPGEIVFSPIWNLYLFGGGNYVFNFSPNPVLGVGISHQPFTHWEFGSGLYYSSISTITKTPKVIRDSMIYEGFGSTQNNHYITFKRLHYLTLPLYANYIINAKNSISAGANLSYLLTTEAKETYKKERFEGNTEISSKKVYGYADGFNDFDYQLFLAYQRRFTNKISAVVQFGYGLTDLKRNNYFGDDKFERSTNVQLTLRYKLK